jgi:hypothetical protein
MACAGGTGMEPPDQPAHQVAGMAAHNRRLGLTFDRILMKLDYISLNFPFARLISTAWPSS